MTAPATAPPATAPPATTLPATNLPATTLPATTTTPVAGARTKAATVSGATVVFSFVDSPIGELLVSGERSGDTMVVTGLYIPGHERRPGPDWVRADGEFAELRQQLDEYFAGERRDFDLQAVAPGTPFQRKVWDELRRIDYGRTASYGEVALNIGAPTASRAVGGANGRNPISIIVPCHRVVGSKGLLTGYAGGLTAKQWLLRHERQHLAGTDDVVELPFPA